MLSAEHEEMPDMPRHSYRFVAIRFVTILGSGMMPFGLEIDLFSAPGLPSFLFSGCIGSTKT